MRFLNILILISIIFFSNCNNLDNSDKENDFFYVKNQIFRTMSYANQS